MCPLEISCLLPGSLGLLHHGFHSTKQDVHGLGICMSYTYGQEGGLRCLVVSWGVHCAVEKEILVETGQMSTYWHLMEGHLYDQAAGAQVVILLQRHALVLHTPASLEQEADVLWHHSVRWQAEK